MLHFRNECSRGSSVFGFMYLHALPWEMRKDQSKDVGPIRFLLWEIGCKKMGDALFWK